MDPLSPPRSCRIFGKYSGAVCPVEARVVVDLFRFRHWDIVSKRGIYYVISALVLIVGIYSLCTKGLNLGIDFKGGGLVTYSVQGTLPDHAKAIGEIRSAIIEAGVKTDDKSLTNAEVQIASSGANDQVLVRTLLVDRKDINHDDLLAREIQDSITPAVTNVLSQYNKPAPALAGSDVVTGTISNELINQGFIALIIGSLLIMGWIGIRYNIGGLGMRYSVAGIIALLHDIFILVGMFALFRNFLQINSPFIAAILTVLGYSIHDTIIIFDRIRENSRLRKGRTFAETVNISLLETMARSVNTILTVVFTLVALLIFGGSTLRDFVAAMLIGVIVGGYSSIFLASQLLVSWAKGKDRIVPGPGEMVEAIAATVAPTVAQPVAANNVIGAPVASSAPSRDAIQRARQAGKSSKRKR